jgi:mannosyl-3-phosphoglycerate phosphatase
VNVLIFTDLDGTLLNEDDYSFQEALPAIELLKTYDIPVMLVSSKTCDEIFVLRKQLDNGYPFVCENGALIVVPPRMFETVDMAAMHCEIINDHRCYRCGESREDILKTLSPIRSEYRFSGFSDMSQEDIIHYTGLGPALAGLANRRLASEPIVWGDTEENFLKFSRELSDLDLRVVKGGRFYHVMGKCDKGAAVRLLSELYQRHYGDSVYCIALGDSPNDLDMLKNVNLPVILPRKDGTYLEDPALNRPVIAPFPGARGWNDAISRIMEKLSGINVEDAKS